MHTRTHAHTRFPRAPHTPLEAGQARAVEDMRAAQNDLLRAPERLHADRAPARHVAALHRARLRGGPLLRAQPRRRRRDQPQALCERRWRPRRAPAQLPVVVGATVMAPGATARGARARAASVHERARLAQPPVVDAAAAAAAGRGAISRRQHTAAAAAEGASTAATRPPPAAATRHGARARRGHGQVKPQRPQDVILRPNRRGCSAPCAAPRATCCGAHRTCRADAVTAAVAGADDTLLELLCALAIASGGARAGFGGRLPAMRSVQTAMARGKETGWLRCPRTSFRAWRALPDWCGGPRWRHCGGE